MEIPSSGGNYSRVTRRGRAIRSGISRVEPVRANVGIIRVMQSIFMASSKISYTALSCRPNNVTVLSTSYEGVSKRLGETELCQLEASGFNSYLEEFSKRSDLCVVEVCCKCKCIIILFGCQSRNK